MLTAPSLSVIVPAYNEEARLERTIRAIVAHLRGRFRQAEVIVVDDGSEDRTADVVRDLMREIPEVSLVELGANYGKGRAVRAGVQRARGDFVLFCDADLSVPIEELEKILVAMEQGYQVVIGSRAMPGSEILVRQSPVREWMGKAFNLMVRVLFGLRFRDTQCGFKGLGGEAARSIFSRVRLDGFAFDVEVIVLALRLEYKVAEVPVRWANSPASKVGILRHPPQMIWELLRLRWNCLRGRYDPVGQAEQ